VLLDLLRNSAATLEHLVLRRKINRRPVDYGHFNFSALLSHEDLAFPKLTKLELRRCTISPQLLKILLDKHPKINALSYYPERSQQLPELPDSIQHLYTNSHLPADEAAVPKDIQALCVAADGPLLPSPEEDFSPPLPGTLSTLHARMQPGVAGQQIQRLLSSMPLLEDVEIVVKPLPWTNCSCGPVSDQHVQSLSYENGWRLHKRDPGARQSGWHETLDIPALASLLSQQKRRRTFTFNHDKHLIDHPFPDLRHNGRTGTEEGIPEWWAANEETYRKDVEYMLDRLPQLRIVHWKVCEGGREAWTVWQKESDGSLDAVLLVEPEL
jgi:hypothetical protein